MERRISKTSRTKLRPGIRVSVFEALTTTETIVLDLEKTLLSVFYKSTDVTEYDDFTFMQIFGNSKVKVSNLY